MYEHAKTRIIFSGASMLGNSHAEFIEIIARAADADPSEIGQPPNSGSVETQRSEAAEETRRKPIISINGRDVDEDELDRVA